MMPAASDSPADAQVCTWFASNRLLRRNSKRNTNIAITVWDRLVRGIRGIDIGEEKRTGKHFMEAVDIRATGPDQVVNSLSGGNQQKVSIAKWLAAGCDTLIIDEPTIGVDIGAKEAIHKIVWDLAHDEGKSIVLISSDLPEMVYLARRILVFRDFEIVAEIDDLTDHARTAEDVSEQVGQALV